MSISCSNGSLQHLQAQKDCVSGSVTRRRRLLDSLHLGSADFLMDREMPKPTGNYREYRGFIGINIDRVYIRVI